jgi:DNA-binding SARP family transcriptional activator/pimeloyl-ACP methyl ester carboxylesterase
MMEIRILGPLEVTDAGRPIDVPQGKARLVLAALVVDANRVVSTDRLVEILWDGEPPVSARNTLQSYVSHLRRSLEPDRTPHRQGRTVITRDPGYLLAVDRDEIDAARFERLVLAARQLLDDAPEEAAIGLRAALTLWRGEALEDFTFEPFAQSEITRLSELRLTALEDCIDAEISVGKHAALCGELARLVGAHPLRERLTGQQMVALYRCGRQAEALRAYAGLRRTLVEQLGIDPSPAVVRLEQAILHQDPDLDWPPANGAATISAQAPATTVKATGPDRSMRPDRSGHPRHGIDQDIRYCLSPDGVCVAYAVCGDGPPLVRAANWLTHLRHEWDSPIWSRRLHDLATRRRLIRYDQRGCGLSDWDVTGLSVDTWVEDLELVVDAAGVERFPLLGLSQGGAVAIAYAARHPERVTHLILCGAYCRGRLVRASTSQARDEAALDLDVARIGWRRDDDTYRQVFASQFLPDGDREVWDAFNDLQRTATSVDNVVKFLDVFAHIDVTTDASRVRCPTLVLHSRGDLRVPQSQAREVAELIPESRLVLLDSRNHVLLGTEPAWRNLLTELDHFLAD